MTQMFTKAMPAPPTPLPPPTMPDPMGPGAQEAARKAAQDAATRGGRSSTILTTVANRSRQTVAGGAQPGAPYSSPNLAAS